MSKRKSERLSTFTVPAIGSKQDKMRDNYILRVTAGSNYNLQEQVEVPVNTAAPVKISTEHMDIELNVRIQNYKGLPQNSPTTSPYFSTEPHAYNKDQYSIAFRFTPKRPAAASANGSATATGWSDSGSGSDSQGEEGDNDKAVAEGIPATDLQFGNDFDHPIRDRLPPGFNTALNIVRWWIDPGLEGDAYADSPYLYGPALSSFNALHVGHGTFDEERGGLWLEEGGDEDGLQLRRDLGAPDDAPARMKWALKQDSKKRWIWQYGQTYGADFFNPYLDFSDFALRLPGFTLPIMKYWDGQGLRKANPKRSHTLRYVLRNRASNQVYLVILFTLHLKEDVNGDGSLKPGAIEAAAKASGGLAKVLEGQATNDSDEESFDEEKAIEEARRTLSGVGVGEDQDFKVSEDDVD